MTTGEIPDEHHVLRYVKPSLLDGDVVVGGAFVLRPSELGLSVSWVEILEDSGSSDPIATIRRLARISLASTGIFAKLNVHHTKRYVPAAAAEAGISLGLTILEAPLSATPDYEADPSHAEIHDLPEHADDAAMVVGDLIAECILLPLIPARAT